MSRTSTLLFMIIGGSIYHIIAGVLGMTSFDRAASELFDATYWGGAALALHWYNNSLVSTDKGAI